METLALLAQICRFGAEWFLAVGTPDEPGTMLITIGGAVGRPSVVEAAIGTRVGDVLALAGGPVGPLQALLVGGFFGSWVGARDAMDAPFSRTGLARWGAAPGAGVVIALPAKACGLAETARILSWYAAESAGQCGPCRLGLADLARTAAVVGGPHPTGGPADVALLRRWADQIDGRGGCAHPDGAVRLLRSALAVFRADLDDHLAGVPCRWATHRPVIHVPRPSTAWR